MSDGAESDALEVQVRYRPSADVLSASVPLARATLVQRDEPDTDTVVEWVRRPDGRRMMVGAQLLFAAARAQHGSLSDALPPPFAQVIIDELAGHDTTEGDIARLHDLTVAMHPRDLLLTDDRSLPDQQTPVSPAPSATRLTTELLCDQLGDLADALADSSPHADPGPTDRLVRALSELADTLDDGGGLAAPGATAAARAAVRGGVPLTAGERLALETILSNIDHVDRWPSVTDQIADLTVRVAGRGQ